MSRRLPTRPSRRSVSSWIVARNSFRSAAVQATSSCSRLVTDALIAASGVRKSCETAERSAVRKPFAATRLPTVEAAASSFLELERRGEFLAYAWRIGRSSGACAGAGHNEYVSRVDLDRRRRVFGLQGCRPTRGIEPPAVIYPVEDAGGIEAERPPEAFEQRIDRRRSCEAGERLGLGTGTCALRRPTRRPGRRSR